jgi:hypothetical protein
MNAHQRRIYYRSHRSTVKLALAKAAMRDARVPDFFDEWDLRNQVNGALAFLKTGSFYARRSLRVQAYDRIKRTLDKSLYETLSKQWQTISASDQVHHTQSGHADCLRLFGPGMCLSGHRIPHADGVETDRPVRTR